MVHGADGGGGTARLIGAQRMVLQAIVDLPADPAGFVTDSQIAQKSRITAGDVRDWIETLEGEGYVNVARTTGGLSASITANGKLVLRQYQPFSPKSLLPMLLRQRQPRLPLL
jgi:hypothetical protein